MRITAFSQDICSKMTEIDPSVGLSVIKENYTVKWANAALLDRYPNLIGQSCYNRIKPFTKPCKRCPVKQSIKDKKVHHELMCRAKGSDVEYSIVASIPARTTKGIIVEAVEVIFDRTKDEKRELRNKLELYQHYHTFGNLLEKLASESHEAVFLLVGALWEKTLNLSKAVIFTLESEDNVHDNLAYEAHSLQQTEALKSLLEDLETTKTTAQLSSLRQDLLRKFVDVTAYKETPLPTIAEKVKEKFGIDDCHWEQFRNITGRTIRLAPNTIATEIVGAGLKYFLVVQKTGTSHDIITGQMLQDIDIYSYLAERSIRNRRLARRTDTVQRKCHELLDINERDAGALIFSSSIISSFAHDIRTSCDNLKGDIEIIWSRIPKRQREEIAFVYKRLTKDILFVRECNSRAVEISLLEKKDTKNFRYYDVNKVIADSLESFEVIFKRRKVHPNFTQLKPTQMIYCEPLLIKQVLSNLIKNACDFLAATTHRVRYLSIRAQKSDSGIIITIEDNGVGINPAIINRIWQPFFSTKPAGKGTGLGLTICKRIVNEIHRGTIEVDSIFGYKTIFTIALPTIMKD